MRNKKLLHLTEQARKASDELTTYLTHLDARETDASYVHARMMFDEGWRMRATGVTAGMAREFGIPLNTPKYTLWMDAAEGEQSPAAFGAEQINDTEVLDAMQLANIESSTAVLKFLIELTDEVGVHPPKEVAEKVRGLKFR